MTLAAFWICAGPDYVAEARRSARTVKRHMPDLWRVLFTPDEGVRACGDFGTVISLPPRATPYWYLDCTRYLQVALSAFERERVERLVFLDTDAWTCAPFYELFELLGRFDLAGAHAPGRVTCQTFKPVPECFPELNIGVLALWNTPALRRFAAAWYALYAAHAEVYGNNDQGALRECLWEWSAGNNLIDNFNFYVLPPEWNCRPVGWGACLKGQVRLLHMRAPDMDRQALSVNAEKGGRLWKPA